MFILMNYYQTFILKFSLWLNLIGWTMTIEPIVLVHGGAGDVAQARELGKVRGVKIAAKKGYRKLMDTDNSMDAVEEAGSKS